MTNYIIRKVLTLIPMMLAISFLIYLGMELMPGDAVDFLIPPDTLATMSAEQLNAMRQALGLNDPFLPGLVMERYPNEFYGGQRQRIGIASRSVG